MLCYSAETPRRLCGDRAETALQIDSQWSRSPVKVAKVRKRHKTSYFQGKQRSQGK